MNLENTPMGRFDWERVIGRAELPSITKAVALFIATRANLDGSSAHPGERWLADVLGKTERYIRDQIDLLRGLGLIERTAYGRKDENFDTYQLTVPGPADIPLRMRLDPNGRRYTPRPEPKKRPRKPKTDADATGNPLPEEMEIEDPATGNPLPEDGPDDPAATGSGLPVADDPEDAATGNRLPEADPPTGSGVPVDNPGYRNPASGSGPVDNPGGSSTTGNPLPSYRKPGSDLPEASFRQGDPDQPSTNTGSPEAGTSPVETILPVNTAEIDHDDPGEPPATPRRAPSLAAGVLDGTDSTWMTDTDARAELLEARRVVDRLDDREYWLTAGHAVLDGKGIRITVGTLAMVTAELYRRSLADAGHPNHLVMNGGT